jgi:5-methylcytosine-specific restriction endonuclease McrA
MDGAVGSVVRASTFLVVVSSDNVTAVGQKLLSLLDAASVTTSYKYAVLTAIVDACLEGFDEQGNPPAVLHGADIGRRVLALYWPQARAYSEDAVLRQSGNRGDLVEKIAEWRHDHGIEPGTPLDEARRDHPHHLAELEDEVVATTIRWPIPLLQRFGSGASGQEERFLYEYGWKAGKSVSLAKVGSGEFDDRLRLRDGVGEALASLAGLLRPLIQRTWADYVARRNPQLHESVLDDFLFGAERTGLERLREPLSELYRGRCFYCGKGLPATFEIDHFLPWARRPDDGLDNLVPADRKCNNDKRAALAAADHLRNWWARFASPSWQGALDRVADQVDWPRRPEVTQRATRALYLLLPTGARLWRGPGEVQALDAAYIRHVLTGPPAQLEVAAEPGVAPYG